MHSRLWLLPKFSDLYARDWHVSMQFRIVHWSVQQKILDLLALHIFREIFPFLIMGIESKGFKINNNDSSAAITFYFKSKFRPHFQVFQLEFLTQTFVKSLALGDNCDLLHYLPWFLKIYFLVSSIGRAVFYKSCTIKFLLLSRFNCNTSSVMIYCWIIALIAYCWSYLRCENWEDVISACWVVYIVYHCKLLHAHWYCYYYHLWWA